MIKYIITFSNQKGGVGKTTLSREIAIFLASTGAEILVIDVDPQANLTKSLTDKQPNGLYEALTGSDYKILEVKRNLYLLSGSIKLAALEKSLIGEIDAHTRIRQLLTQDLFKDFQFIILDTPPSLGVLTINALTAASNLIIPMSPALYSMQGTNDLMATVTKVKQNLNPDLNLLGVIINGFDSIPVITRQIREEITSSFGDYVFNSVLSKSIKIEEAIAQKNGLITLTRGKVKDEIITIGEELIQRLEPVQSGVEGGAC